MNPQNESQDFDPTSSTNSNVPQQQPVQSSYSMPSPDAEPPTGGETASADPLGTTINAEPAAPIADPAVASAEPASFSAAPAPAAFAVTPVAPARSKKPLLAAAIIGGALLLLGGTAAAYQFWYQNPDKVVTDSLANALSAETTTYTGTLDTNGQAAKLKVDFDGSATQTANTTHAKTTVSVGAVNVTIDGNIQTSQNGDMYVKLSNAKDLAGTVTQMLGGQSSTEFDAFVAKVNDKWIKITPKDLNANSGDESGTTASCVSDTIAKIRTDATMRRELTDLYGKNRFITVTESLGEKDGSLGYKLDGDKAKLKEFIVGVKKTQFYLAMQKCDSTFKLDENDLTKDSTSDVDGNLEIWVNKWNHQITQLKATGKSKESASTGSLVIKPVFNKPVTITAPNDALTVGELQSDYEALTSSMIPATVSE